MNECLQTDLCIVGSSEYNVRSDSYLSDLRYRWCPSDLQIRDDTIYHLLGDSYSKEVKTDRCVTLVQRAFVGKEELSTNHFEFIAWIVALTAYLPMSLMVKGWPNEQTSNFTP